MLIRYNAVFSHQHAVCTLWLWVLSGLGSSLIAIACPEGKTLMEASPGIAAFMMWQRTVPQDSGEAKHDSTCRSPTTLAGSCH